jgi:sugar phosphate permease
VAPTTLEPENPDHLQRIFLFEDDSLYAPLLAAQLSDLGYRATSAGHMASYFELFGFLGSLAAGYAVQRYFNRRRMTLGACLLFALAFICLVHPMVAGGSTTGLVLSIALMGILIHGADILMSGMAVLDAVPNELHGRAAGLVNAIGSVGQALSPLLITVYVSHLGSTKLFDLFVFFALVAGTICAFGSRGRHNLRPVLTVQRLRLRARRCSLRKWIDKKRTFLSSEPVQSRVLA